MTEANVRGQKITFAKMGQPYGMVGILAQNWFRDVALGTKIFCCFDSDITGTTLKIVRSAIAVLVATPIIGTSEYLVPGFTGGLANGANGHFASKLLTNLPKSLIITYYPRMWRNWQTRRLQVPVGFGPWRFDSSHPH